jgi:hypothetical protein
MRLVVINDNCYWVLRVGERLRLGGGAHANGAKKSNNENNSTTNKTTVFWGFISRERALINARCRMHNLG